MKSRIAEMNIVTWNLQRVSMREHNKRRLKMHVRGYKGKDERCFVVVVVARPRAVFGEDSVTTCTRSRPQETNLVYACDWACDCVL